MVDYALWEVIKNGNTAPKTTLVEGVEKVIPPTTTEEKAQRRLELKARSTLLIGIPNEHQLKLTPSKMPSHYYSLLRKATRIDDSLPRKEKDPRSFTLPCYITNVYFENAFADLGASLIIMPLLTHLNLGLCELAHTKLTVELADRTVKYPKGIVEIILVGIGKFVFPVDFIILDMPKDVKMPLILRRPFLSAVNAKIDVFKRKITLRVGEEKNIFKSV
ncbi:hypothetical protein Tco_0666010 [Tanacetum coccineum]